MTSAPETTRLGGDFRDLARRAGLALAGGGALLAAALWEPPVFYFALWAVGLVGLLEGWHLLRRVGPVLPWTAIAFGLLALVAVRTTGRHAVEAVFLLAVVGLVSLRTGEALLASLYVGLWPVAIAAVAYLYHFEAPALVLCLLLSVWAADVGAYVTGALAGRTPLAPSISPKKTREGVAGGLVLALAVGAATACALGRPAWKGLGAGLIAGVAGPFGDLAESRLKRFCGAKDSGRILLGHGGVLDRFDAFAAAGAALALARLGWRVAKIVVLGSA